MTSITPIRDPQQDELLTPQNSALLIIDYQPQQVGSINSMNKSRLIENIVTVAKLGKIYKLPIILSTVNVQDGRNGDTITPLKEELKDITSYDRTAINAWEDAQFKAAVEATGRKKLIVCALWTEACLTFPSLDAMKEGYDAFAVVDAVGGTSRLTHMAALNRLSQAGAKLTSITQILCELQRDWNRAGTVKEFVDMLIEVGAFPEG
jgi:nicotinamidase-related amidase